MSTLKTNTLANAAGTKSVPVDTVVSGSAKAWVNFNGTGTVAIRASFNVSSITDNGTGNYTVNFTQAMSDANYSASGICSDANNFMSIDTTTTPTETLIRIRNTDASNTAQDGAYMNAVIHR